MSRKKAISTIVFLILVALVTLFLSNLLRDKTSRSGKNEYFNAKTDFDALYFGASRMHEAIDPIYIWQNYGVSSYNLASAGESIQITYFVVKEALEHSHPKVVFVDSAIISDEKDEINCGYGFVHQSIDALPLNQNKLDAIKYAGKFFDGGMMAFLSPLYAYHNRYEGLTKDDFKIDYNYDKGAYMVSTFREVREPAEFTDEADTLKGGDGTVYLTKILDLCKERGVQCVLVDVPVPGNMFSLSRQRHMNALKVLTEGHGGVYMGFNEKDADIDIDYRYNFGDSVHLNYIGGNKAADKLAKYMTDDLGIEDHRDDPSYAEPWKADIEKYRAQCIERAVEQTDAAAYINWLRSDDYTFRMYVKDKDLLSTQYAMDYCIDKYDVEVIEDIDEEQVGNYDMKIEVRRKADGEFAAKQFFKYDYNGKIYMKAE
ncbi:hypothetical protein SAMN06296386_10797 [Lachnospiraceae bacterium]|nr:hypothetical protein SAMN06296386_10797 [Lachnospiraceae bacterium]